MTRTAPLWSGWYRLKCSDSADRRLLKSSPEAKQGLWCDFDWCTNPPSKTCCAEERFTHTYGEGSNWFSYGRRCFFHLVCKMWTYLCRSIKSTNTTEWRIRELYFNKCLRLLAPSPRSLLPHHATRGCFLSTISQSSPFSHKKCLTSVASNTFFQVCNMKVMSDDPL